MTGIRRFLSNPRSFMLGAAIGSGMTARAAERAGADFVIALNAGRFRAMGGSSPASILPIRDNNAFVASFGRTEILKSTKLPVFFGVCMFSPSTDPELLLDRLARWGVSGVTNFPSVIHLDDRRRAIMDDVGLGYDREISFLTKAADRGLMTIAYTRTQSEARRMVEAGIQAICMNFNLNAADFAEGSNIGLTELAARCQTIARTVHSIDKNVVCLLGGGPITRPDELMDVCKETGTQGFIGGSSLDRVPLEMSVLEITSGFKTVHVLRERVEILERQLRLSGYHHGIVAQSASMNVVLERARQMAVGANPVLIVGESGTGKRRLASLVHALGSRKHRKPTVLPCRQPPAVTSAALFGTQTDVRRRIAILESASESSVILLHVDGLSSSAQEKLADYMESGLFSSVDGTEQRHSTTKIIATANTASELTPTLAAAFSGYEIGLPPLRDRLEDLPLLITHFTAEARGDATSNAALHIENSAFQALAAHHWPGNIRDLRHVVERLAALPVETAIDAGRLAPLLGDDRPVRPAKGLSERDLIIEALRRNKLHRGKTAAYLGMSRKTLFNKIKKLRILE
ncbi:phosphoenolpyruvate hydrolase family protein [Phyllobacterium zundukense]|uniref:Phosphoenolpyruvate hydrolase family protein n=1 Tax=Phyllobacterium zundukense TaxID=1867719 RepID=A0ACD4CW27_9HYPH|nr:phosphoenolpyruvate hydrolase family protein [Phyllobacterium zundukense]UXN57748.1 phosphoenolpyruvate hydrolase family protein [Phyllobacterium zundukense]